MVNKSNNYYRYACNFAVLRAITLYRGYNKPLVVIVSNIHSIVVVGCVFLTRDTFLSSQSEVASSEHIAPRDKQNLCDFYQYFELITRRVLPGFGLFLERCRSAVDSVTHWNVVCVTIMLKKSKFFFSEYCRLWPSKQQISTKTRRRFAASLLYVTLLVDNSWC